MTEMTASFSKGKASETSISHNNRSLDKSHFDYSKKGHQHIKSEYTSLNEVLVHEDIHDVYRQIFDEPRREYNAKQKRKDRQIKDYYKHVQQANNRETQIEFIAQIGAFADYKDKSPYSKEWQDAKSMLKEYLEDFEKRNQQLVVYNAVVHMDESTPHLHFNCVPVGEGYKRGLSRQASFVKALQNEGYEVVKGDNRAQFKAFRNAEADALADIMVKHGIERKYGHTNHLRDVHEYKEAMREKESLEAESEQIKQNNAAAKAQQLESLTRAADGIKQDPKDYFDINYNSQGQPQSFNANTTYANIQQLILVANGAKNANEKLEEERKLRKAAEERAAKAEQETSRLQKALERAKRQVQALFSAFREVTDEEETPFGAVWWDFLSKIGQKLSRADTADFDLDDSERQEVEISQDEEPTYNSQQDQGLEL